MFDRIDTNYAGTGGATMEDIDVSASANAVMFIGYGDEALGIEGYGRGLFVRDLETGLTEGIAYKLDGSVVTDVNHAFLSDNGRFVVYTSAQDGIVADDHNGMSDVFRYDRSTGTTALISRAYDGSVGNGSTVAGAISGNGAAVAFMTTAANLQEQHRKPIAPLAVVSVVLNDDNSKVSMWRENSWDSYTTVLKDEYYIVTNKVLDQQTPIKIYQVIDGGRFGGFASFSYDSVYSFEQTVAFRNPVDGYDPPAPSKQYTVWKNEMAQSHYSSQQQYPEQHMISLNANGTSILASTLGGGLYYSGDRGQILAVGGGSVSDVQIAENGRYVAFRSGGGVYIWDVDRSKQTGEHVFVPITLDGMTTISAFSLAGNGYSIIVSGKASDGSLVTLRVDNPAFAGGPSDGDWIPDLAVGSPSFRDGGSSSDKMYGTSGDDGLSGHGGADYIYGGVGNDILDGGAGADLISGGIGDDIITGGPDNDTIDGGSDLDEGDIDVVRYSGSIEDYRIVDVPPSGDQAAHVRVSSVANGHDTLYNVEKLQFDSARTNVADVSSLYLTMAKAAAIAYGGTVAVDGWVALTSLELGLRQIGHNGANGAAYGFANGVFTGNGTNDDDELFAVSATVTFAVVRGVPTVQVAIRGEGADGEMTASLDDAWLALQPLVEALGAYVHDTNADGGLIVGGVLITGHGMGGALAQMLMADPAFAGDARVVGATFGSPGAATAVIDDPRLLHFEHASDPIALAADYVRHDGDLTGAALHQWEEMNGHHAVLALAGDPALAQMVGTGGTVRIGIDGSVMPGFAQHDMAQYLASLTKLAQVGSAFEFMQSGVEGLGGLEVVDVLVGTGGRDVLEGTEPALVNALRGDGYSSADQQFFGGGDNDILYGGSGSDRFVGEAGNDDIDGGANDPDSIDILTLQGSAQDYVFNDVAAANGQPGHSEVSSADSGHDTVRRVEFAEFDMLRTNVVTMDHPMLTMAEAALAVYDDAHVLDGGWAALSALEFGIALDGKIGDSGGFSFADGVYRAQSGSASITAHVYFGVADGKNTLVVALRGGQGQTIDWQNYSDIPLQTALLDPLKIAIGGYLTTGGHTKSSEVDAVMVTGHGVGGALAQTLLQDPAFVHDPRLIGATFGSPGAATGGQDYRVLHVEHAYDPATAIAAFAREERDGDLTNYHAVWKRYFMTETADWVRDPADIEELSTNGGTIRVATDTTVALGQSQHEMETYLATVERLVAMRDTLPFMTDGYWGLPPNGQIDIALGGAGNDTLVGADADLAYIVRGSAEPGNDLLLGGIGQDLLIGGEGKDVFAGTLAELNGDTIGDIVGGEVIRIYGVEIDPLAIRYIPGVDGGILDFGIGRVAIRHAHDGKFDVWDVRSGPDGYTDIGFAGGADVTGDEGDNSLSGGSGDDRLFGGAGNDRLRGGEGADRLLGDGTGSSSAQRSLAAASGDDTLDGGAGADIYTGGAGRDTFLIDGDATDRITDFEAGVEGDRIDVSAFLKSEGWNGSTNPFADGMLRLEKRGADLVLVHDPDGIEGWQGGRDIAVLDGAAAAMLVPDNFTAGIDPRVVAVVRTPVVTKGTGGNDLIDHRDVTGPHWIDGGNGNDDLRGGTGPDRISGGAGDDLLRGGAGADEIDGGSGEDTLVLNAFRDDYRIYRLEDGRVAVRDLRTGSPDGWDVVRNVENIRFLGGTMSIDEALDAEPRVTLRGTKQNDGFLMQPQYEDNADLSQGGDDFIYGHPGDNVINFEAALTASDLVNGNGGVDTVAINGDYSAGLTLGTTTLTDVDVLRMAAGHSYTLTLLDGVAPAEGRIFLVDGSDLGAPDLLRFDGSASQLGAMIVKGGAGNDVIRTGMTSDYITGGRGDDRLDGGGGDDIYRYERIEDMSAAATTYTAAERIALAGGDRIDLAALGATFIGEGAFTTGVAQIRFRHDGNWTLIEANGTTGATVARIAIEGRVYLKELEPGVLVADEAPPAGGGVVLLEGDERGNVLSGTEGTDKILGRGGNDTIDGGGGNDWIDGGTGNDVLTGGTGNEIFFFDNAGVSGFDRITDFKSGDLIATTRAISDSNKDGIITFAASGPLRLDNSDKGDRVQIDGLNGKVGLRALGELDGLFYYGLTADRPTPGRKQVVIEGTVGNDILGGKSASELYFFDNRGPLPTGHDRVTSFGRSDKLLTTIKLAHDAQGRVVANADGLFALGQDSSVALANAGSAVLGLRLDTEFDQNGRHFYSYTAIDL